MKKLYIIFSLIVCIMSIVINAKAQIPIELDNRIIIDPGHGGIDGGASGNGIIESSLNLEISLVLKEVYEENGYAVDLTRYDNEDLCEGKFIKKEDMNKRINKINSGNYLFCISVHQNTFSDTKYRGAQTFYSNVNKLSKDLAFNVQESIKYNLNNTERGIVERNNVLLLNKVIIPIVLIECGFLTNSEEAMLLKNKDYQKKLAYSIYYGSIKILR